MRIIQLEVIELDLALGGWYLFLRSEDNQGSQVLKHCLASLMWADGRMGGKSEKFFFFLLQTPVVDSRSAGRFPNPT